MEHTLHQYSITFIPDTFIPRETIAVHKAEISLRMSTSARPAYGKHRTGCA